MQKIVLQSGAIQWVKAPSYHNGEFATPEQVLKSLYGGVQPCHMSIASPFSVFLFVDGEAARQNNEPT